MPANTSNKDQAGSSYFDIQEADMINKSWERATTLPPRCYTDPEFYEIEKKSVFSANWLCAGRVEQIPNAGDYFTINLVDEPLIIVRDHSNGIKVLSRVCRHRWMMVVEEGSGNKKTFQCPYHLWTYDLSGGLIGAPHMKRTPLERNACQLPSFRFEVWQGFIFVNLDGKAPSLTEQLKTLEVRLTPYKISEMNAVTAGSYHSDWNWKVMIENVSEVYHLCVHQDILPTNLPVENSIVEDTDGPYSLYRVPTRNNQLLTTTISAPETLEHQQRSELVLCTVFPCHVMVINPDQLTWIQILSDDVLSHKVEFYVCFAKEKTGSRELEEQLPQIRKFLDQIHRQDIAICKDVQRGLASRWAVPSRFSHLEKSICQLHQWIFSAVNK